MPYFIQIRALLQKPWVNSHLLISLFKFRLMGCALALLVKLNKVFLLFSKDDKWKKRKKSKEKELTSL